MFTRSQLKHMQCEHPVGDPFGGPAYGAKRDFVADIFGGNDAPPPPDYSGIAAANEKSAQYAKEAADNDLAFRKQVYADSQPMQRGLYDLSNRVANEQLTDMGISRGRSAAQWGQYQNTFVPVEQEMVREAMDYGGQADQDRAAASAVADARTQAGLSRASNARAMAAMGVNPNSGRFAGMARGDSLREAAMAAGGANNARIAARDKGIGLRAGAAAFGRNQVNSAGQMTGLATASGNSAVGNANTGFMSGLPYAQFAAGGTGNQIAAAGQGIQANLGLGGLMNSAYQAQSNAAANSGGGLGALIGAAGQIGAAYMMS